MKKYIPKMYQESIYTIDYDKLKEKGITCILFDLDNTLVPAHINKADSSVKDLLQKLKKKGFLVIIFSNSPSKRLKPFEKDLEVYTNAFSMKPLQRGFQKVFHKYKVDPKEVALIGDQLLTDVRGGNKAGITTILIHPICTKDMFLTKWNRRKENKIIEQLEKENLFARGVYYE